MSSLVPFNRRRGDLLSNDFYNVLDDFFSDSWTNKRPLSADTFKMDIVENDDHYELTAQVPGFKKEDIHISLDEKRLTIEINHEDKQEVEEKNYVHREIRKSSMKRSVYLNEIDSDRIEAKLEDGILNLYLPKLQKQETKRLIEIQ